MTGQAFDPGPPVDYAWAGDFLERYVEARTEFNVEPVRRPVHGGRRRSQPDPFETAADGHQRDPGILARSAPTNEADRRPDDRAALGQRSHDPRRVARVVRCAAGSGPCPARQASSTAEIRIGRLRADAHLDGHEGRRRLARRGGSCGVGEVPWLETSRSTS